VQNEFNFTIEVMKSLAVPTTLTAATRNISNLFDRETNTIWAPTVTPSSVYAVVIKTPESPLLRAVQYYAFGDGIHDADTLQVSHSNDGSSWQTQKFTLRTGTTSAQGFMFRNRIWSLYWKFEMTKNASVQTPLFLRELYLNWSVSCVLS
jgi:hypothetical protein